MNLPRNEFDPEAIARMGERVKDLTESGLSAREIADILNCSSRTVTRYRARMGILQEKLPAIPPEKASQIESLLADGASCEEAARTFGVNGKSVRNRWPQYAWSREQITDYVTTLQRDRHHRLKKRVLAE